MSEYILKTPELKYWIDLFFGDKDAEEPTREAVGIKKVIYNPPATIVLWTDGTKTVAKCEDVDFYDKEKGFLICVIKKVCKFKNSQHFRKFLEKWVWSHKDEKQHETDSVFSEKYITERASKLFALYDLTKLANTYEELNKWHISDDIIGALELPEYIGRNINSNKVSHEASARIITPLMQVLKGEIVRKSVAKFKSTIVAINGDSWEAYMNEHKNLGR